MRNRKIQRALKKAKISKEERLDSFNSFGFHDPTPDRAVKGMIYRGETATDFHEAIEAAKELT